MASKLDCAKPPVSRSTKTSKSTQIEKTSTSPQENWRAGNAPRTSPSCANQDPALFCTVPITWSLGPVASWQKNPQLVQVYDAHTAVFWCKGLFNVGKFASPLA